MSMVTSQILNFADFTKTQKSKYLEKETLFSLQIKNFTNYTLRTRLWQKKIVAEVTFKDSLPPSQNLIRTCDDVKTYLFLPLALKIFKRKYNMEVKWTT